MSCLVGNCASFTSEPMFRWLREFRKIIVTGPQRSGTRICAKIISYDIHYDFMDEARVGTDSLYRLWTLFEEKTHFVVQCPALCRYAHIFSANDTAVIMMRREVAHIIASQERISWQWEDVELARYDLSDGEISRVKYEFWERYQKEKIQNAFDIDFLSLHQHPLWINESLRSNFAPTQTSLTE